MVELHLTNLLKHSNLLTHTTNTCLAADHPTTGMHAIEGMTVSMLTLRLSLETCGESTSSVKMELKTFVRDYRDNLASTFTRPSIVLT